MKYIGVDLSLNHTGLAVVDETGAIKLTFEIDTDTKSSTWHRIIQTINSLDSFLEGDNEICIEDVYFGLNAKGAKDALRLSGALMYHYFIKFKNEPLLLMATSARKLVGLSGDCLKTEVQMFVIQRFNLASEERLTVYKISINTIIKETEHILNPLKEEYKNAKIEKETKAVLDDIKSKIDLIKKEYKKAMLKISKEIEKEFNLSEHKADALILALALKRYKEAQKEL